EAPDEPSWAHSNWQSYCVRLPDGIDQRAVMQALLDSGISTRRGVMNVHLETAYAGEGLCRAASGLKRSEEAQQRTIILPLFPQMTDGELDTVTTALRQFGSVVQERMPVAVAG